MNHLNSNTDWQPRQAVRPLERFESIPNLCTACLLEQEIKPLLDYSPGDAHYKHTRSMARFAPHIPKIKQMLKLGYTFYRMGQEIDIPHQTITDFVSRNKEMFE